MGGGGLSPAGGAVGLVLRAQGAGQAGWHLLCCLLPTWAAGSSLEGDGLHLGPQGTRQLSAQSHRLASQFLLLCRGVSAQTRHPTKDRGTVIQKKMNFLQEPRPPGIPGHGMRDPCRGCPIAHRTPDVPRGRGVQARTLCHHLCHLKTFPGVLFGNFNTLN